MDGIPLCHKYLKQQASLKAAPHMFSMQSCFRSKSPLTYTCERDVILCTLWCVYAVHIHIQPLPTNWQGKRWSPLLCDHEWWTCQVEQWSRTWHRPNHSFMSCKLVETARGNWSGSSLSSAMSPQPNHGEISCKDDRLNFMWSALGIRGNCGKS